ncbi:hypothetical protein ACU4GD_23175 [Cupriavidus basilensis]
MAATGGMRRVPRGRRRSGLAEAGILPPEAAVREAVGQSPTCRWPKRAATRCWPARDGIRAGTAEAVVRAIGQGRQVREPSERYAEGRLALERPPRLRGKADADGALADATVQSGQLAVMDARLRSRGRSCHCGSRRCARSRQGPRRRATTAWLPSWRA